MSSRVLSHAQFSAQVNDEGASRRIGDLTEGPKTGAYVSTPRDEKTFDQPITGGDAKAHLGTIAGHPEGYQGGWTETEKDTGKKTRYLDRSVRVHSPSLAVSLGEHWGQESVYVPQPAHPGWKNTAGGPYVDMGMPAAEVVKRRARVYGGGRTR